jgi:hypothetical protein
MAIAVAGAPVIYPWYLLYFTPFLLTIATLPLVAWTMTVLSTYAVWQLAYAYGARWVVPPGIMRAEYAIPLVIGLLLLVRRRVRDDVNQTVRHEQSIR